jgi:hypothetical protein
LFARILGSQAHPQGRILSAYRQARRALASGDLTLLTVAQVLADLQVALQSATGDGLRLAAALGMTQAQAELALYDMGSASSPTATPTLVEQEAWMTTYAAQANAVRALALNGDRTLILGDAARVGVLAPALLLREGAKWLALATQKGYGGTVRTSLQRAGAQDEFMRQAVAAIDERTTDCCLRVHGQVVAVEEKFRLTGTPRYADELAAPPFHDHCRSSTALVRRSEADDDLSQQMRTAARDELRARGPAGDNRQEIHPAHATSRR